MSVLCKAVVFLLLALPAVAQSQAFEVISIKPARSGDPRDMRMRVLPNGDLNASAAPVLLLLRFAYDVPVNPSPRLSGLPGWRETYDIEAKAPANAVPPGLPESEKRGRMQGMIRGLLADRFKLVMRVEQKTMPVYALSVASGGPNLQKSTIAEKDCVFDTGTPESCHNFIVGRGQPPECKSDQHGRPCPVHRELDRFAGGEPHGSQRAVRRRDGRLDSHAAAASSARQPAGRALR